MFLGIGHAHGDLCKHLGIDSSTNLDDRYSNLFLNAYINRHAHTEYLKMIKVYSPLGIWHVFLYSITSKSTYTFTSVDKDLYEFELEMSDADSVIAKIAKSRQRVSDL